MQHSYRFYEEASQGNFYGLTFGISPSSVKWSIDISPSTLGGQQQAALVGADGLKLTYILNNLTVSASAAGNIRQQPNTPEANMTTYYLPVSSGSVVAQLEVFDVALVDQTWLYINHSVEVVPDGDYAYYVLVLEFPPFTSSLHYDPSIGFGVLLGNSGSGTSDNTALIASVAVIVPVVVIVVVSVMVIGGVILYIKKKKEQAAYTPNNHRKAIEEQA